MGENSKIEWCDHTFNPWLGCTKLSPACDHCYAETWANRFDPTLWQGNRRRTGGANWRQPLKWNREAWASGVRRRVFCASLADVFDNQVPEDWRADLWKLIDETPYLDWLLLTKRPQNAAKMITAARRAIIGSPGIADRHVTWPWPNVWLGTTVENQEEADRRIPHLLQVPVAVHFLSCEPLLGPVNLTEIGGRGGFNAFDDGADDGVRGQPTLDWVICGGESGPNARPMHPDWARSLRDQCAVAGVPFFFKQWGEWAPNQHLVDTITGEHPLHRFGKKAAGRLLDGLEHGASPEVRR